MDAITKKELVALRKRISASQIPSASSNNFRMLTWNIRNLNMDKEDRAITYVSEVMKDFDVIAIQECKESTIEFIAGGMIDFNGAVYLNDQKLKFKLTDHLPMWAVFNATKDKNPKYINP